MIFFGFKTQKLFFLFFNKQLFKKKLIMKKSIVLYLFLIIIFYSCQKAPEIAGFDSEKWIENRGSCESSRESMAEILEKNKEKIYKLSQNQVLQLLGKPDLREPYQRGQVFYIYLLEEGVHCSKASKTSKRKLKAMILRFTAIDKVVEIRFEDYKLNI